MKGLGGATGPRQVDGTLRLTDDSVMDMHGTTFPVGFPAPVLLSPLFLPHKVLLRMDGGGGPAQLGLLWICKVFGPMPLVFNEASYHTFPDQFF